ncbi:MAG: hypothetical protein HFG82_00875 [Dorea sp.]|jgi:hypothetical protein|nr:hypothetical protein [Dorea sp.]
MLYIGNDIQNRMNLLGLTIDEMADSTFMEKEIIDSIIQNKTPLEEIDEFDMSLICSVLHCKPEFFTDDLVKEKDLLLTSMNRGMDNKKSLEVKAIIHDFMNDLSFVEEILSEMEEVRL